MLSTSWNATSIVECVDAYEWIVGRQIFMKSVNRPDICCRIGLRKWYNVESWTGLLTSFGISAKSNSLETSDLNVVSGNFGFIFGRK